MFFVYVIATGALHSYGNGQVASAQSLAARGLEVKEIASVPALWAWNPVTLEPDATTAPRALITPFDFANRFTIAEEVAIRAASQTDGTIEVFLRRLDLAQEIRTDHPLIIEGLAYLVTAELLTPARALEIGA